MVRKGIDLAALFYIATALVCFIPYFQYGHPLLIASGLIYALPFFLVGGGLALRKIWSRKLAITTSVLLILVILPLLFKKKLSFAFSFPFFISVTYPPSSVRFFKGLFGGLIIGHVATVLYLLRGSIKEAFQQGSAGREEERKGAALSTGRKEGPAPKS